MNGSVLRKKGYLPDKRNHKDGLSSSSSLQEKEPVIHGPVKLRAFREQEIMTTEFVNTKTCNLFGTFCRSKVVENDKRSFLIRGKIDEVN